MTESELLLSPTDSSDAVELSQSQRVYRKRILPKATINYRGRKINFDDAYLTDLASSYQQGAYDQVAFMLAPDNNSHTLDPERFRGEVQGVEVTDDGLYATIQVTPQMAEVLKENPKLGVSARILENYARSDGKHFPRALQHVLGTLDPVIAGLGSWEEVELSRALEEAGLLLEDPDSVQEVLADGTVITDLSNAIYEPLENPSPASNDKEGAVASRQDYLKLVAEATDMTEADIEGLDMTDDELAIFASAFEPEAAAEAETAEEPAAETEEPAAKEAAEEAEPTTEDIEAAVEALTDEELAALAAELGIDPEGLDDTDEAAEETEDTAEAAAEDTDAEDELIEEEAAPEPTDSDLAARLGAGDFEAGIEEPVQDEDTSLDGLSDAEIAQMTSLWADAQAKDAEAAAKRAERVESVEAKALAVQDAEEETATSEETPELVGAGAGPVALSNPVELAEDADPSVVALSNQVTALQRQLATQEFEALKREYVRQGVPAALVDLARPVLTAGPAATLEFSNAAGGVEQVDAASIVRQLLDSATGYIELAQERGHSYSPEGDRASQEAAEDKRLASLWGEQYGH